MSLTTRCCFGSLPTAPPTCSGGREAGNDLHESYFMNQTLLIADGDAELCDDYRRVLTERGYEVETSSGGLDCLRKLRQKTPAALVLNLELFWGGGDGVLAWLREENPKHEIPVILTATTAYPQNFAELIEPPVVDCLLKPLALTALVQSLELLLLAERIKRALRATGYGALRDVEVVVNARIVRLVGRVPNYYLKQLAQVTALAIPGTHQFCNDLNVIPPS